MQVINPGKIVNKGINNVNAKNLSHIVSKSLPNSDSACSILANLPSKQSVMAKIPPMIPPIKIFPLNINTGKIINVISI